MWEGDRETGKLVSTRLNSRADVVVDVIWLPTSFFCSSEVKPKPRLPFSISALSVVGNLHFNID